jgi:hypothetical protein
VLGGDHDGVEADRAVAVIFDRDLGLPVGAQIRNGPGLAHLGQPAGHPVGERDRQGHQLGGLAARVAEHEALVSGALPVEQVGAVSLAVFVGVVDALRDVGRLGPDGHRDAAGGAVEALVGRVVTDLEDLLADQPRDVDVGFRGHLAGHVHLAGGDQSLDGDAALGVALEHGVEDGVTDLVGDLVRVSLGDRLGGEQAS